jgi:hypothetical protein
MINKIEDLKNTWVKTSNHELVGLYVKKAMSLGSEINSDADTAADKGYSCVYMMDSGVMIGAGSYPLGDSNYKELTLSDLKPRTKNEFVKCEYSDKVSNVVMDFENNAPLYKSVNDEYWTIDELDDLFQLILNDCHIYRKVEIEIDERQEFVDTAIELLNQNSHDHEANYYNEWFGAMFDSGKFKLVG